MTSDFTRRNFLKRTAGVSLAAFAAKPSLAFAPPAFERDRYLLIDARIVEQTENVKLSLGKVQKHGRNPLFAEDKPWEKRFDNLYGNVIYDEQAHIYKCWYSPFIVDLSALGMGLEDRLTQKYKVPRNREMGICYATSQDGLVWDKPALGLVEFDGSSANNIVWRGAKSTGQDWYDPHGAGIFKDINDPDPKRRYKAFFKGKLLSVGFSADGIHWSPAVPCPEANVRGDTHNNAFWAPTLGHYVGITREWGEQFGRQVARTTSTDFVDWTNAEIVLEGLEKNLQTYAMPVFYHAGIYLGLLAIHDQEADRVWTELTWSPDTETWYRVSPGTPLVPNGEETGAYDWGCVYACATPVFLENEIRLYYGGSDGYHFGWRNGYFCLATLRPDGFAGYETNKDQPGIITTKPIIAQGSNLRINADIESSGSVMVTILNNDQSSLAESALVEETGSDVEVRWRGGAHLEKGAEIRLRFELRDAKLYSFSFG